MNNFVELRLITSEKIIVNINCITCVIDKIGYTEIYMLDKDDYFHVSIPYEVLKDLLIKKEE